MIKRVAYLCLQATREGQASCAHVHEIIHGLERRGWEVDLFEPRYARAAGHPGLGTKFLAFVTVQFRLWMRYRKGDLLYVRAHPAAWPTAVWARLRRVPTVQEVNGHFEDFFVMLPWTRVLRPVFCAVMRAPLALADRLVVVTPQLADWARRETRHGRIAVIPNGANTELFQPGASAPPGQPSPYVIFFGTLARWQGIDTLLTAVRHPDWPPGVRLLVAGDGVERPAVEAAAAADPNVVYLGRLPQDEVARLTAGSLAGLIPKNDIAGHSKTGLSPLKLYETLACGVPVILTDVPGQADLVREVGAGLVVPLDDPVAIARAVAYLAAHDADRTTMGRRGRDAIVREHSWDRRAEMTSDLLASLASVEQVHV